MFTGEGANSRGAGGGEANLMSSLAPLLQHIAGALQQGAPILPQQQVHIYSLLLHEGTDIQEFVEVRVSNTLESPWHVCVSKGSVSCGQYKRTGI